MSSDWMSLFLAFLVGASVSWMMCSMWTMRWIERERRRLRDSQQELKDFIQGIVPEDTPLMRELKRLQEQERFNRERA